MHDTKAILQSLTYATGAGVRVAVLDSGVNPAFPGLTQRLGNVYDCAEMMGEITITSLPDNQNTDRSGHGSLVESCIISVAPNCRVDHFRIVGPTRSTSGSLLCYVLDHVVNAGYNIVNLSLGIRNEEYVPWLVGIIKRAYESNTCIVSANSNIGSTLYPAWFTYAITCDAISAPHPLHIIHKPQNIIEFSGFGVNVPILTDNGNSHNVSGSSYATAHITGLTARIVEILGHSTPLDIKFLLREYARNLAHPQHTKAG